MQVRTFGVIGSGQMGNGIAQVAAASGLDVLMSDISDEFTARGVANIEKNLNRSVGKGKINADEKELKQVHKVGDKIAKGITDVVEKEYSD